uniref:Transmembrane protein n=1 Tax=Moniliophthora roreri TaxID=221103 RepID=A0A0W0F8G9_MONRR
MAESKQFDQFVIEDTSPTVVYSPTRDTFGKPDYLAGWNPILDGKGADGVATTNNRLDVGSGTYHITSRQGAGVSLSISFQGTHVQLLGAFVLSTYDTFIDGQRISNDGRNQTTKVLAIVQGLSEGNHTISLNNIISLAIDNDPPTFLEFDKAVIRYPVQSLEYRLNYTLDPSNQNSMTLTGGWSSDSQLHQSNTAGDKAQASFIGVSLQIRGTVSPTGGDYSVKLDNSTYHYTARSSFTDENTLLFHAGNLSADTLHSLEITNDGGGSLILAVNGTTAFDSRNQTSMSILPGNPTSTPGSNSPSRPSSHLGAILGGVFGGLALVVLIAIGILFFRKRRQRSKHLVTTPFTTRTYDKENTLPVSALKLPATRTKNPRGEVPDTIPTPVISSKQSRLTTPTSTSLPSSVDQESLPTQTPEGAADLAHMRNELANLRETVQNILSESYQDGAQSEASAPPAYRSSVGG